MKRVFKQVLIASAMMLTALTAGVITSCSAAEPEENLKNKGYSCCVTYDANGGTFGATTERTYAYVKENSLTAAPGFVDAKTQASIQIPTRKDHQLVGEAKKDNDDETNDEAILTKSWFQAKTDENGNIIYEGEGENKLPVLVTGEPWDFTKDRVTEDITLIAQWKEVFRYIVYLTDTKADGEVVTREIRNFTVNPGDTIVDRLYKKQDGEFIRRADYLNIKESNYTLLDFYLDDKYTTYLETDYVHPGTREITETVINPETNKEETVTVSTNTVNIYVKYLIGKYDLISNNNIKQWTESSKWYVLEDVDMTGKIFGSLNSFNGEIHGNGYTLKNLTISAIATKPSGSAGKMHSIFGKMNGLVENLTLDNVTLNVNTRYEGTSVTGEQKIAFFGSECGSKGKVNNVTIKNSRILISSSTSYQWETTTNGGGLWWTTPSETQVQNVIIKQDDEKVDSISVEVE